MFGTRDLFSKAGEVEKIARERGSGADVTFLTRLYQQGKQISQITAYIWRWIDEDQEPEKQANAMALKEFFEEPAVGMPSVGAKLKQLFKADPTKDEDQSPEANLLRAVFMNEGQDNTRYIFPIFDQFELGLEDRKLGYMFQITVNAFTGRIEDAEINAPELLKMVIPYPPRPPLGDVTVNKETLEAWIDNRNETEFFAANHYIPTSCT